MVAPNYGFKTEESIPDLMIKIKEEETFNISVEQQKKLQDSLKMSAGLSSEYSTLYNINKNEIYLAESQRYFKNALYGFYSNIELNSILGIASLDLYNVTEEIYYLEFANYLYDNIKIEEEKIEDNEKNPYAFSYLLFFSQELEKINPDYESKEFVSYQEKIRNIIVSNGFDKKGFPSYKYGQKAFLSFLNSDFYSVKENAFLAGVLNNFQNTEEEIQNSNSIEFLCKSYQEGEELFIISNFSCEDAINKSLIEYPGIVESINLDIIKNDSENISLSEDNIKEKYWLVRIDLENNIKIEEQDIEKIILKVNADSGEILINRAIIKQ